MTDVAQAREYVTNYVPDPAILKDMPDEKVLEYHTKVSQFVDTSTKKAVEEFKAANPGVAGNWREQMASAALNGVNTGEEYAKELKRLERFATPADVYPFGRSLEKKLSSGEYYRKLPQGADEKELATFRKEAGIPEKPEDYFKALGDLQIGEADKPIFTDFFENVAHKNNLSPDVAKEVAGWYYDLQKAQQEVQAEEDQKHAKEGEDILRSDQGWGRDYRANLNAVENLKGRMPKEVLESFANARYADGRAVLNDPKMMMFLARLERDLNPTSTFIAPGESNDLRGLETRIAEIQKVMSTDRKAYNKDANMQRELLDLLAAQEKMKARGQ